MNGPALVCVGCGGPANKPICNGCAGLPSGAPPEKSCLLCYTAQHMKSAPIMPADKFGIHKTRAGGYAGKCEAVYG